MVIRSKAPLRLGLAGGGSDVSPYSDIYGGFILNATIDLYAYCTINVNETKKIEIVAADLNQKLSYDVLEALPIDGNLDIIKGVYNRLVKDYHINNLTGFRITTHSDAPPGSGLGSSSTMVVAIVKAFTEWWNLPLGEYDIAHLAYEIERIDLALTGGKQDQYAATFGGFNFMEFLKEDKVIVNPLRIKRWIIDELESSMVLFFTGASRSSAKIIEEQQKNTSQGNVTAIEAMHNIKQSAIDMKEALLKGDISSYAKILGSAWVDKKKMATSISNESIDIIYDTAIAAGALSGKVSGAGGGGFMMFVVDPEKRINVINALKTFDGRVMPFHFSEGGCHGWKIYN
ncbi:D-glycero-alpha-D-manno-heptose-7-phosphate kinase [Mucilaginibacter oryzae]|uniref:D-glycero-alpha-D-manno-heptose-7-phosphate kinase n=1 Tax=Mucilaginibacter oryzae TaxID=468058 RepID=A0A316HHK0_9SPHI|nr:dehydrogenase [Mucilaginibacter oryzae]PWK77735.1 D-glycero-alpha-D-manno-heptose-7-phosphate kinase [Mucilaginibacter oryzae]